MKPIFKMAVCGMLLLCFGIALPAWAADEPYGASGASKIPDGELTLAGMLTFAIQDEYLARGEYQKVMANFGTRRPFSNIIQAEERHIAWLKPLFAKHGVALPLDRGLELAKVPETFVEALKIGVDAEIANIAMYERFLKKDLPEDVRAVFNHLLLGSRNHLAAFQRGGGRQR